QLISFDVQPPSGATRDVLASIAGQYDALYGFDPNAGGITSYFTDPAKSSMTNLLTLQPLHAYWLHALSPVSLTIAGSPLDGSAAYSLQPGWNLAGWRAAAT